MARKPRAAKAWEPSESEFQRGAMRYLEAQSDLIAWRVNCGGLMTPQGHWFRGAPIGTPDIQGAMRGGRAFYIELKTLRGVVSEAQCEWLRRAHTLGIAAFVCRDFGQVLRAVRCLRVTERNSLCEENLDAHGRMAAWNRLGGEFDE